MVLEAKIGVPDLWLVTEKGVGVYGNVYGVLKFLICTLLSYFSALYTVILYASMVNMLLVFQWLSLLCDIVRQTLKEKKERKKNT